MIEQATGEAAPTFDLAAAVNAPPAPPGTIGVVTGELLRYSATWRSISGLRNPAGTAFLHASGLSLPANRNGLVDRFKGDWLFTLDDDVVLLPDTLTRLLAVLDEGFFDMVSAHALHRSPPFPALVFRTDPLVDEPEGMWTPDGRKGVMEIAACGLPAVLIHRRVFDGLDKPYFRVGQVDPGNYHEDVEFCRRVRDAGFRIAVDLDTPVGHVTPMALWPARDQNDRVCAVLVGGSGEVVPVDTDFLRAESIRQPALVGL